MAFQKALINQKMLFNKVSSSKSLTNESSETTRPVTTINPAFQKALIIQKLLFAEKQADTVTASTTTSAETIQVAESEAFVDNSKLRRTPEPVNTQLNHKRLISKIEQLVVTASQEDPLNDSDAVEFDLGFKTARK
jgi:hypothetical protein